MVPSISVPKNKFRAVRWSDMCCSRRFFVASHRRVLRCMATPRPVVWARTRAPVWGGGTGWEHAELGHKYTACIVFTLLSPYCPLGPCVLTAAWVRLSGLWWPHGVARHGALPVRPQGRQGSKG